MVAWNWQLILISVVSLTHLKMLAIWIVARLLKASYREVVERLVLMAQGGEFALVLSVAAIRSSRSRPGSRTRPARPTDRRSP